MAPSAGGRQSGWMHLRPALLVAAPAVLLALVLPLAVPGPAETSLGDPLAPLDAASSDWSTGTAGLLAQELRRLPEDATAEHATPEQVRAAQQHVADLLTATHLSPAAWAGTDVETVRERLLGLHHEAFSQQFIAPLGTAERPSSRSFATQFAAPFAPLGPPRVTGAWEVLPLPGDSGPATEALWFGFTVAHGVVAPDRHRAGVVVVQIAGAVPLVAGQDPAEAKLTLGVRHLGLDVCTSTATAIAPALGPRVQAHLRDTYLQDPALTPADLYGDGSGPPPLARPDPQAVTGTCGELTESSP